MKIVTLGDPHLGRRFITGVPPHRRGDREEMVWVQFRKELMDHDGDLHVCLGDLFDGFNVPAAVLLRAADIYQEAAAQLPRCGFIVLRGNHDVSRDTTKRSAFDVFTRLVDHIPNITVIDCVREIHGMGFVPYDAFLSAEDQVAQLSPDLTKVFMHHDYTDFGGDHVIPTKALGDQGICDVVNGHDHVARTEKRHGVTVTLTGSMQPYTHAEDPEGTMYRTLTLDELSGLDTENLNLRIVLREGEDLPEDLDCLSLVAMRQGSEEVEDLDTEEFDNFDLASALAEVIDPTIREEIMEVFRAE